MHALKRMTTELKNECAIVSGRLNILDPFVRMMQTSDGFWLEHELEHEIIRILRTAPTREISLDNKET